MTLVACGEDSLDSQYLASLNNVTSAATENGQLILYLEDQENRMLFDNGGDFEQDSA
jgi:heat shock protein HslJ